MENKYICDICKKELDRESALEDLTEKKPRILCFECCDKEYPVAWDHDGFHPVVIEGGETNGK